MAGKPLRLRYRMVGDRGAVDMQWAGLAFAIGLVIIFADYRMATAPDPADKYKRRKKLNPVAAKQLRSMFLWTIAVTAAVYYVPDWF
jgi:hypothetical protein